MRKGLILAPLKLSFSYLVLSLCTAPILAPTRMYASHAHTILSRHGITRLLTLGRSAHNARD
jgi:hypothetical protein